MHPALIAWQLKSGNRRTSLEVSASVAKCVTAGGAAPCMHLLPCVQQTGCCKLGVIHAMPQPAAIADEHNDRHQAVAQPWTITSSGHLIHQMTRDQLLREVPDRLCCSIMTSFYSSWSLSGSIALYRCSLVVTSNGEGIAWRDAIMRMHVPVP